MNSRRTGFVAGAAVAARPSFSGAAVCAGRAAPPAGAPLPAPARIHMRSAKNLAVKEGKVSTVRTNLESAGSVFQVELSGISVAQISQLKRELPEGSTCQTVKNTLMKRAVEGTDWSIVGDLCSGSTVWFFVKDDIKATVEAYNKWSKTHKREADILGGAMDDVLYDGAGVKAIAALPSKQELYGQIAMLIRAVPTKLARSVKAVPTKVGRAINLAVNNPDTDAAAE
jgi:large subunit ribosomal protein L10